MNILLINHYAGSPAHGMEYRPFYLAREWVRAGHRVTILAASFSHVRGSNPQLAHNWQMEEIEGVRYLWVKTPPYPGNGARRALNIFAFVGQLLLAPARLLGDPQVIIASSTYPLDVVAARWLARRTRARVFYEVHDLWPLSLIELGGMSPGHPFVRLIQWAENYAYRRADRVVSMLPKAREHMLAHGLAPEKYAHIPNGVDITEWERDRAPLPGEHASQIINQRAAGRFLVGYAGAHGIANALDSLVRAAALLKDEPVAFFLVGQGPEKPALQALAAQLGAENVFFLPTLPRQSIPAFLEAMDALYIGLQREPLFRFGVSPNKLMDYMMAARPVIYAIEAGNDPVADSGCGFSIPPEDPAALAAAVISLSQRLPAERDAMGRRGLAYVTRYHPYQVLARQFLEILQESSCQSP
jgi:glycosyltransferase involved in cell wall biosynthesis